MSESNGHASRSRLSSQRSQHGVAAPELRDDNVAQSQRRTRGARGIGLKAKRVWAIAAVAVVLVAGLGVASFSNSNSAVEDSGRPRILAVQTVSVQPVTSYQAARNYTGAIVARRTSELGFELRGKLTKLYVNEGDSVNAGREIAELDIEHLETMRRQLVARRAQASAKLDEMLTGPRDEDIAAGRARVASLQAQVELLTRQTARHKNLRARNVTSQDEYEQYAFGLQARQSQHREANHNLDVLLNGTRKERIEGQRAAVAELDAAIADVDVDLRKSTLKAPFDGTIARRLADEGTVVEVGQPVFRLVEDQALEAWIGLPVHATHELNQGAAQRVKIDGRYFDAAVSGRFPEVDPATRTRTVVLTLENSGDGHVVHGQVVRLELEETVEASGYWLPSTALTKGARGLWTSFVVVQAEPIGSTHLDVFRVERRDVEVLHTESNRVLVRGTLNSGDRVVTNGTHRVVPNQLVRLAK
jgi:RND family efflux transporter MFP subunit